MNKVSVSLLAAAFAVATVPAFAADLPRGVIAAPAPAAAPTNTITLETSPEFSATGTNAGSIADWYAKGTYSHNFGQGISGSVAFQDTLKDPSAAFPGGTSQQYYEGALAYKLGLTKDLSFTVTGTLGYTAGATGYVGGITSGSGLTDLGNSDDGFLYYAISGAVDWKVDSHWTWNVINARYRNAFDRTWITPKVTTGITYAIDPFNAVYANIGYSWKDAGSNVHGVDAGLLGDKFNIAVGYKYSF